MNVINPETQDKIIRLICALIPHAKIYQHNDIEIVLDAGSPLDEMVLNEIRYVLKDNHIPNTFEIIDYYKLSAGAKKQVDSERNIWKN